MKIKTKKIKSLWYAFTTYKGYDYSESAISEATAIWMLNQVLASL